MKKTYKHSSELLMEIIQANKLNAKVTFQDILEVLSERAFGIMLIFFSLPSALPFSALPGVSFVFSLPISLFALQMVFGRKTLWLPKILSKYAISYEMVTKIITTSLPYIKKIERLLKPRLNFMTSRIMEIINGIIIFILTLLLMLPIPFSNLINASLIIIFGLGFSEKDGIFIILGYIGTIFYIIFLYLIIQTSIKIILSLL